MRKRRRKGIGVSLPWENRGNLLRDLLSGSRWRMALVVAVVALLTLTLSRIAEQRARERQTRLAIEEVRRAVQDFRADVGRCPRSTVELVHPPRSGTRYLHEMPRDGYGVPLHVRCPGQHDPDDADVISAGPSGSFLIDDNVL